MARKQLVLIVDDDPDMVRLITKILTNTGFDIKSAMTIKSARQVLEEDMPNIITLDIDLGGVNGLNLLKFVKDSSAYKHIPVIIFTAKTSNKLREQAEDLGALKFLTKPLIAKELIMAAKKAAKLADIVKLEKVFTDNSIKVTTEIKGDITEINELSFTLISPVRFTPKDTIEVTAPFLDKIGANICIQRVNKQLSPREGGFCTKVSFVGMDEDCAKNIRKNQRK